ncbi:MAG: Xaa-Pro peptidase family protein [Firmicutes bacterium]|nr:Xaa-Pro peptidase family protein [Bacillota bacterium]
MIQQKELDFRLKNFKEHLDKNFSWDIALIFSKVNQYYFTGTLQEGVLAILKNGQSIYFVRKSLERAKLETIFDCRQMTSFSDIVKALGNSFENVLLENDALTHSNFCRLKKYIGFNNLFDISDALLKVRAVKTDFELEIIKRSGKLHGEFMNKVIPKLFKEGMTEFDFAVELYYQMVKWGHHGVSRFNMFQMEIVGGQFGFSENSLYPTNFDGPGGAKGMSAAVPIFGDKVRKLKRGDLIFVDIAFGVDGYHTDKTQVYFFGTKLSEEIKAQHNACLEIQKKLAALLKPGAKCSEIYNRVMSGIQSDFLQGFMNIKIGYPKFLAHGVGLHVDELPIIALKADDVLKENMVIAIEPKKAVPDFGLVGSEDTYIVTNEGGLMITDGEKEIIIV